MANWRSSALLGEGAAAAISGAAACSAAPALVSDGGRVAEHDDQQRRGGGDRDHAPQPATAPPRHRGDLRGDPGAPEMILRLGRERLDGAGVTKQVEDGQLGVDRASAAVLGLSGPQRVLPARVQDGLGSAARDRCVLSVAR
jgi:hypothetical protein